MRTPRATIACGPAVLLGLLACTTAPSGLSDDLVVLYGVGHRDGEVGLEVHADGRVIAREQRHDALLERRAQLGPTELQALRRTLEEHRCCSLRSRRKQGVPDEARPRLAVRWDGEDCKLQMWDGEWSGDPDAAACLGAVEDLHGRVMRSRDAEGDPSSP